jgi:hypothetical protein
MNDSIENQPQNDVFDRTVSFRDSDNTWGYPAAHLMAMQFEEPFPLNPGDNSEIILHFSAERVRITGEWLRVLWDNIVIDFPTEIFAGEHGTGAGKYVIKKIQVIDETA